MADRIEYLAHCHCGNLSARYRTAVAPAAWSVRACQCSFCRSHGLLATSDPAGEMEFRSTDSERVQRYRFGGRTAEVMLCRECGVVVGVQMDSDLGRFGVLSVLALRPLLGLAGGAADGVRGGERGCAPGAASLALDAGDGGEPLESWRSITCRSNP